MAGTGKTKNDAIVGRALPREVAEKQQHNASAIVRPNACEVDNFAMRAINLPAVHIVRPLAGQAVARALALAVAAAESGIPARHRARSALAAN